MCGRHGEVRGYEGWETRADYAKRKKPAYYDAIKGHLRRKLQEAYDERKAQKARNEETAREICELFVCHRCGSTCEYRKGYEVVDGYTYCKDCADKLFLRSN